MEHVGNEGRQTYNTKYYNLDMIISIGFRVNSKKAIKFRTWASKIIKDYMVQGFALNDDRFMKASKKAETEYEKYKVIQDRDYVSDFDKLMNETKQIENK